MAENAKAVAVWTGEHRLSNAGFTHYAGEIVDRVRGLDLEKIPIGAAIDRLDAILARLVDFVTETRIFDETAQIRALDRRRDALFGAFWAYVRFLSRLGGDGPLDRAARTLANIVSVYKGLAKRELTATTSEIRALKIDLEKTEAARAAVAALGLGVVTEELFAVNEAFSEKYSARIAAWTERSVARDGETTVSLRREAARLVVEIVETLNAVNLLSPTEESLAAAAKLRAVVAQAKETLSHHRRRKRRDGSGGEEAAS